MRIALVFLLCCFGFRASAQWWSFFKKHERLPQLEKARTVIPPDFINKNAALTGLRSFMLPPSNYNLELAEARVMKTAQHNMRFRIYDNASYDFNSLAQLYVQQNRFSEAKWYFLQSTMISRQQNNDKLTISNLTKLAMVKSEIGDFILAQQDLLEARNIAASRGWLIEVIEVEKKLDYIQRNRFASLRRDNRYAELASAEN